MDELSSSTTEDGKMQSETTECMVSLMMIAVTTDIYFWMQADKANLMGIMCFAIRWDGACSE